MAPDTLLLDEKFLPAAQDLVSRAKTRIWISTFKAEITSKPRGEKLSKFFNTLFEKARSGVDVRFMTNRIDEKGHIPISNVFAIRALKKNNVKVRHLRDPRICHAKIILVDCESAILGSHNLSVRSCHNNFEVSYLFTDLERATSMRTIFEQVWDNAKKI